MPFITAALIALSLLLTGAYAGMTLICQIGVLPAMRRLSLPAYADAWRAMDFYLDKSMPPYKVTTLLVTLAATVLTWRAQDRHLAAALLASFLLTLLGLVLTVVKQLPLNARLKTLPQDAEAAQLLEIREATMVNFSVRFVIALLAFAVQCVAVVWWPAA